MDEPVTVGGPDQVRLVRPSPDWFLVALFYLLMFVVAAIIAAVALLVAVGVIALASHFFAIPYDEAWNTFGVATWAIVGGSTAVVILILLIVVGSNTIIDENRALRRAPSSTSS